MKRLLANLFVLVSLSLSLGAQVYDPVIWNFSYEKKGEGNYDLVFVATIEEGSHIYSMDVPAGGPIPTSFSFDTVSAFSFDGKAFEVTVPEEKHDEAFGFRIKTFSNKAEFRQKIRSETSGFIVRGLVNFMSCNNSTCSPPKDVEFEIQISDSPAGNKASGDTIGANIVEEKGLWKFFIGAFLLGLVGVLTPCVYPMIPMTVAFFTRESEKRSRTHLQRTFIRIIYCCYLYLTRINNFHHRSRSRFCKCIEHPLDSKHDLFPLVSSVWHLFSWGIRDNVAE